MASESIVEERRTAPGGGAPTVAADQAVYSSVRTPFGKGYQIIAASKGMTANEKQQITTRSPSHGGLCAEAPDATGLAFYELKSGRLCLACSRDGGAEHTGRGVRRIYTHITVVEADDFVRFGFNPFNLLSAVERTGVLEVQLETAKTLETLELRVSDGVDGNRAAAAIERCGPAWVTCALSAVLEHQRLVTAGDFNPADWIETILLGVPGPLRPRVSFSAGLRFSVGRQYAITAVTGDLKQTRRLVRGQRLKYLEPNADAGAPEYPDSPWLRMVRQRYQQGRFDAVAEIASQPIADCSDEALDRIGTICNDTDAAKTADSRELLRLADARLNTEAANDFEANLLLKLVVALQAQLCDRLRTQGQVDLCWPDLLPLLRRSRRSADFALPVVGVALERLAFNAPARAAVYALEAVEAGADSDTVERLEPFLATVLQGFGPWVPGASPDELERARSVLRQWRFKLPHLEAANSILNQIEQHLGNREIE